MRSLGLKPELLLSGLNLGKLCPLTQVNNVISTPPPDLSPQKCFEVLSLQIAPD